MKKIWILALGTLAYIQVNAQSESFPLYYSQYGMNGTAAYIGKAGAIGALGGDIMSAHYNPAGLGLYTSNEITFSLGIDATSSNARFNGFKADDSYPAFNYGNLGMVLDFNNGKKSQFRHIQLSFGINRLMNFNNRNKIMRNKLSSSYISDNVMNVIIDNNDLHNNFISAGVIDTNLDSTTNAYVLSSVYENGTFNQIKSIRESGYLNEFTMSISTNYENVLYLGATIGIPFGDYTCNTSFSEERFISGISTGYYNFNTEQRLSATGINLKLGAIARPTSWLRLGATIHTPTWYSVTDDYFSGVEYNIAAGGWYPTLEYNMQSPWRFLCSGAVILGNNHSKLSGTLSVDYEYTDYSHMQFNDMDDIMAEAKLNNNIDQEFGGANTIRLGGEMKYSTIRLRAGYAHFGNPYSSNNYNSIDWDYMTLGVGYKGQIFSFDLAYAYGHTSDNKYYMYDTYNLTTNTWSGDQNPVKTETTKHLVQATVGIRF